MEIKTIVLGQLPRKSNGRRKTRWGGLIKSQDALDYEVSFIFQIPNELRLHLTDKISLTATIYYRSNRSDLSDELLCDCIEKAGIIKNDRQIKEKHLYCRVDKENPRVEFELKIIGDEDFNSTDHKGS